MSGYISTLNPRTSLPRPQMVLPSDREEVQEFIERSVGSTRLEVKIHLPHACLLLPDKHFFEVLYNRYTPITHALKLIDFYA